ncbi:hypothetical protein H8Z79_12980 [Blautia sp. 2744]|uniref:Uncharacterized protein n=1 Tax=Blautia intestinalis TaxID=2763028 RepID=A0ABR7I4D2_9FIRM|nr:hypothetical protein [Blautia intestinalis]MBC5741331.1 hypothetical protein [Blautia intestinalis]
MTSAEWHSTLFQFIGLILSLDQLIKGDITTMKEEISKEAIQKFNRDGAIFTVLLILTVIAAVPLAVFLGYCGYIVSVYIFCSELSAIVIDRAFTDHCTYRSLHFFISHL